jgi:hypothetical protein
MKKTSENVGVKGGESKIDYFQLRRETPVHLRKHQTTKEFHEIIQKAREEKLKQVSQKGSPKLNFNNSF